MRGCVTAIILYNSIHIYLLWPFNTSSLSVSYLFNHLLCVLHLSIIIIPISNYHTSFPTFLNLYIFIITPSLLGFILLHFVVIFHLFGPLPCLSSGPFLYLTFPFLCLNIVFVFYLCLIIFSLVLPSFVIFLWYLILWYSILQFYLNLFIPFAIHIVTYLCSHIYFISAYYYVIS